MNLAQLTREETESESESRRTRSSRNGLPGGVFPVFDARPPALPLSTNSPTRVQTRLTVSEPGDRYEQEADRIAAHVMSMDHVELNAGSSRLQRKAEGSAGSSFGSGQALDRSTREFFESRLGEDLNDVRIHTGANAADSARELNAQAYTLGRDVVFATGQYQPHTTAGKELIAHELAHTVQQRNGSKPTIQRKLAVSPGLALDTQGFSTTRTGDVYTCPKIVKNSIWNELFTSLLFSPRTFTIDGDTNEKVNANLNQHMAARLGIVEFASKKKYTFAAGLGFKMNPAYWIVDFGRGTFYPKPGVDRAKAVADLNVNPKEYAIACEAATSLTVEGGSKSPVKRETGIPTDDWIPGDWGYIENTKFPTDGTGRPGLEGENLIYTGKDKYWGHFGPGIEYKTLQEWFDQVKGWHGGAVIADHRIRPVIGLK
jgi:uncharacterized protein DUF4157